MGQPLFHLGVSCLFHLRNFRFHGFDQLCELGFALLSGFGVDVVLLPLAVWQARIEAAFPEAVVNIYR